MFSKSARFYDLVYAAAEKDYQREVKQALHIIQNKKRSSGNTLLEVACGTGLHASGFEKFYAVEGLDLDAEMLAVARGNYIW
jgi:ubiquinone/menaquinone biosynthesis C-methylase UbiE